MTMPERWYLCYVGRHGIGAVECASDHPDAVPYVPESRLLAAEARVREVEAERDAIHADYVSKVHKVLDLRAERDALVALLRYFLAEFVDDGDEVPRHDCGFVKRPESGYCEFHDKWVQAQAILVREAGE